MDLLELASNYALNRYDGLPSMYQIQFKTNDTQKFNNPLIIYGMEEVRKRKEQLLQIK